MLFEKPSLRTRVTFEAGMTQLGGHAIYLTPADIRLGERETVQDAARNLERWVDAIVARTFSHQMVERLARYSRIPVINGLTDTHHPVQILCDLFTLWEKRGRVRGLRVAFIGDGNNVCHSWLEGAAKVGVNFTLACPKGYEPDPGVLTRAMAQATTSGATLAVTHDPEAAARGADVLYTDVWASMGQEDERARRLRDFQGFQVDERLVRLAASDVLVMHCLPAHRGEEIAEDVIEGPHSIVFDEAENRLHMQKAILVRLLGGKG
jgi:ornithine carbamoyltransferase